MVIGGNTFEAAFRIVTQTSITARWTKISRLRSCKVWTRHSVADKIIANLLPDIGRFDDSSYVAGGFDIPGYLLTENSLTVSVSSFRYLFSASCS